MYRTHYLFWLLAVSRKQTTLSISIIILTSSIIITIIITIVITVAIIIIIRQFDCWETLQFALVNGCLQSDKYFHLTEHYSLGLNNLIGTITEMKKLDKDEVDNFCLV